VPMSASDYLDRAGTQADSAVKARSPEDGMVHAAISQAIATAAVAAAIERLAEAVENLAGQAQGKS
jgi:hypothetical protein